MPCLGPPLAPRRTTFAPWSVRQTHYHPFPSSAAAGADVLGKTFPTLKGRLHKIAAKNGHALLSSPLVESEVDRIGQETHRQTLAAASKSSPVKRTMRSPLSPRVLSKKKTKSKQKKSSRPFRGKRRLSLSDDDNNGGEPPPPRAKKKKNKIKSTKPARKNNNNKPPVSRSAAGATLFRFRD